MKTYSENQNRRADEHASHKQKNKLQKTSMTKRNQGKKSPEGLHTNKSLKTEQYGPESKREQAQHKIQNRFFH
jgi:hypothetical protein